MAAGTETLLVFTPAATHSLLCYGLRRGGGGRRDRQSYPHGDTTMLFLGILLSIAAIGFLCWLLFTLAVFAMPVFAGVSAGVWTYHSGAGWLGAILVGITSAALMLGIVQFLLIIVRPLWMRMLIAIFFVAPAAVAGFHATHGIAKHTVPSEGWQIFFSIFGAIAVAATAFMRVTAMVAAVPSDRRLART